MVYVFGRLRGSDRYYFFFLEKAVLCLYDYGVGLGDVDRDWSSEFGRESV